MRVPAIVNTLHAIHNQHQGILCFVSLASQVAVMGSCWQLIPCLAFCWCACSSDMFVCTGATCSASSAMCGHARHTPHPGPSLHTPCLRRPPAMAGQAPDRPLPSHKPCLTAAADSPGNNALLIRCEHRQHCSHNFVPCCVCLYQLAELVKGGIGQVCTLCTAVCVGMQD